MLYIVLMLATGCMIAMQSPINASLSRITGPLEASLFSFLVGTLTLVILAAFFGKGNLLRAIDAAPWQWCGGLLGAIMVFSAIVAVPRIGVLSTALAMIVGNLFMASIIDNFGWFGAPLNPFTLRRLFGLCMTFVGLYFIFKP